MTQLKHALLTLDGHRHLLIMANSLNAQDVHIGIDGPKERENGQSRLSCLQSHHGGWEEWLRSTIVQKLFLYCLEDRRPHHDNGGLLGGWTLVHASGILNGCYLNNRLDLNSLFNQ